MNRVKGAPRVEGIGHQPTPNLAAYFSVFPFLIVLYFMAVRERGGGEGHLTGRAGEEIVCEGGDHGSIGGRISRKGIEDVDQNSTDLRTNDAEDDGAGELCA